MLYILMKSILNVIYSILQQAAFLEKFIKAQFFWLHVQIVCNRYGWEKNIRPSSFAADCMTTNFYYDQT
jgi:hypothetical protein